MSQFTPDICPDPPRECIWVWIVSRPTTCRVRISLPLKLVFFVEARSSSVFDGAMIDHSIESQCAVFATVAVESLFPGFVHVVAFAHAIVARVIVSFVVVVVVTVVIVVSLELVAVFRRHVIPIERQRRKRDVASNAFSKRSAFSSTNSFVNPELEREKRES